jgi:DNA modification methylase
MRGDVWDFPTLAGKAFKDERTNHPTQKPESLITELIKAFCPMKDGKFEGRIFDPFHGSGTLGVCCEKLNAQGNAIKWTGVELEKEWCQIAVKRLNNI